MKTIGIFCQSLDENGEPFRDPLAWDSYSDLLLILKELGANVYFITDNASYLGNGLFAAAYTLDKKGGPEEPPSV